MTKMDLMVIAALWMRFYKSPGNSSKIRGNLLLYSLRDFNFWLQIFCRPSKQYAIGLVLYIFHAPSRPSLHADWARVAHIINYCSKFFSITIYSDLIKTGLSFIKFRCNTFGKRAIDKPIQCAMIKWFTKIAKCLPISGICERLSHYLK